MPTILHLSANECVINMYYVCVLRVSKPISYFKGSAECENKTLKFIIFAVPFESIPIFQMQNWPVNESMYVCTSCAALAILCFH